MKITIEVNGHKIELTEDMFEGFGWSMPSDVYHYDGNRAELGHAHLMLGGQFKEGVRPEWVEA